MISLTDERHCDAKDCVERQEVIAAYLWYDGYLALQDQTALIPISEPFSTMGRPERELVPGGTCFCMSDGGIPVICDKVYDWLESLGASGETADLIYRGFNKKAQDTIQDGYRRFLPKPEFALRKENDVELQVPNPVPDVFAIKETQKVVFPKPKIRTQFHIGISRETLDAIANAMPTLLVVPLVASANN